MEMRLYFHCPPLQYENLATCGAGGQGERHTFCVLDVRVTLWEVP